MNHDPTRDLVFEAKFLADVVEAAGRLGGITNNSYPPSVERRLAVGRERYGDGNFLDKDNLQEVLEETPDIASYSMLELERLLRLGIDDEIFDEMYLDLVAAGAYAALSDHYARRAMRTRQGLE